MTVHDRLPGAKLVLRAIDDARHGRPTPKAALAQVATIRLAGHGLEVPPFDPEPPELAESAEGLLYARLLAREGSRADAYAIYRAWLDELRSFLDALDHRALREARAAAGNSPR